MELLMAPFAWRTGVPRSRGDRQAAGAECT